MWKLISFFALFITNCFAIPETTINFTIALRQQHTNLLENYLLEISDTSSPLYGHTIDEPNFINMIVAPSLKERENVKSWLSKYKINIIKDNLDSLNCNGEYSDVEQLFGVKLIKLNYGANERVMSLTNYQVPDQLSYSIDFVEGITYKYYPRSRVNVRDQDNVDNRYAGREVIARLYNISNLSNLSNKVSLASIEYQGQSGFNADDLLTNQEMNNVAKNNITHIVGNDAYPDEESQLDVQMMGINAPNASIWFWDGNDWLYSLAVNMVNNKTLPDVISMSWGWSESDQCSVTQCNQTTSKQYVDRVNVEYIKLGIRGVTITVSSGDAGAPGRTNEGCFDNSNTVHATFPGSSPWVTSIGATYVVNSGIKRKWTTPLCKQLGCATSNQQFVTNNNDTGWTSGGGINNYTDRKKTAKWQDSVVTKYLNSGVPLPLNFNKNGRAYPDVSVIGHSCPVVDSGTVSGVDGTSCSSPVFASIVAILNDHQLSRGKKRLGFLNPVLYQMYQDNPKIFGDITEGDNWSTEQAYCPVRKDGGSDFGYKATKGFDPVYG